jgi:cytochrome c-type biogenesis protein CcmE
MTIKPVYILAGLLAIAGVLLAATAMSSSLSTYLTVSEATGDPGIAGKEIQVLAPVGNISYAGDGSLLLDLTDGKSTLLVSYAGAAPPGITVGKQVVAIGRLTSPHQLEATEILVKCPSKYG